MSNETRLKKETAERKSAENKALLTPLGKYAAIAVLMVSIIVTTAIMVDKQLNSVDSQIAEFESKAAEQGQIGSDTSTAVPASLSSESTTSPGKL